MTRLAGSDTTDAAGLRGTVSVLQIRGPSGTRAHPVQPGTHDWADAMTALRQAFTFLAGNWRQAAADSTGASLP